MASFNGGTAPDHAGPGHRKRRINTDDVDVFLQRQHREKTLSELLLDGPDVQPERALAVPTALPRIDEASSEAGGSVSSWWSRWNSGSNYERNKRTAHVPEEVTEAKAHQEPRASDLAIQQKNCVTLNVIYAITESQGYLKDLVSNLRALEKTEAGRLALYEIASAASEVDKRNAICSSISIVEQFVSTGRCAGRIRQLNNDSPVSLTLSITLDPDERATYERVRQWLIALRVAVTETLAAIAKPRGPDVNGTD